MPTLARGDAERLLRFVAVADELAAEEPFTPETLAALKLSDFWSLRQLRRTRTYEIWCRPWDIDHSISVPIPSPLWYTKTFITRIWHSSRKRRLLSAALTALGAAPDQDTHGAVLLDPLGRAESSPRPPAAARVLRDVRASAAARGGDMARARGQRRLHRPIGLAAPPNRARR